MKFLRQEGQALLEMALVLPLLLILLLGTVELGRVFHSYIVVTQASREGARAAAIGRADAEITDLILTSTGSLKGGVGISITPGESEREIGNSVTVKVQYQVDLVAPLVTAVFPDPFPVEGLTSMRVE